MIGAEASVTHTNTCTGTDISLAPKVEDEDLIRLISHGCSTADTIGGGLLTCENRRLDQLYEFIDLNENVDCHLQFGAILQISRNRRIGEELPTIFVTDYTLLRMPEPAGRERMSPRRCSTKSGTGLRKMSDHPAIISVGDYNMKKQYAYLCFQVS